MLPELGNFAIILALCFAILQSFTPRFVQLGTVSAMAQLGFLSLAMLILIINFINDDITVLYVREHSHYLLPILYKIGAAWGGHEGSLLLWCLILSAWTFAFIVFSGKNLPRSTYSIIIMVLGLLNTGFITFLFITSNPFKQDFPETPIVGNDLTPLLQDPGLLFHPPALYVGYIGFAIPFAFAIAALFNGKLDKHWARLCKPWVILPWAYLSCGIVLGSWWAYRELGWGGWWFWDPVENASLLPWLSATALLHSLIVSEKRNVFKGWTLLLAIITFGLSLMGTFLVRSGILVSVHAFASDPARGVFLLSFLAMIIGIAFFLYAIKIKHFYQQPQFNLISRETALLTNSVVLLTAMATIALGTLYPIMLDSLNLEKISVGEPYFNIIITPIILFLLLMMGFAPHMHWGRQSILTLWKKLRMSMLLSIVLGITIPWMLGFKIYGLTCMGLALGIWVILSTAQFCLTLTSHLTLHHLAMIIAHLGIAILVLGITINKSYSEERQVKLFLNEKTSLAGYELTFSKIDEIHKPNYHTQIATFLIHKNFKKAGTLKAEQRVYLSHDQLFSKPGIHYNAFRDLYLTLGTLHTDGSWSIRIYYKPCVRWIWFGGFMLLLGGLITFLPIKKRGLKHAYH